jgi:hypothetical protein
MKKVGERIRFVRQHILNLSGKKIAELAKVGQVSVSHWESGRRDVPLSFLSFLSHHFSISLAYLVLGEGPVFSIHARSVHPEIDHIDISRCDPHFIRSELLHHSQYAKKAFCIADNKNILSVTFYPQRKMFEIGDNININFLFEMQKATNNEIEITVLSSDKSNEEDMTLNDLEKMEGNKLEEIEGTIDEFEEDDEGISDMFFKKIEAIRNYLIKMPDLVDIIYNLLAIVSQKK